MARLVWAAGLASQSSVENGEQSVLQRGQSTSAELGSVRERLVVAEEITNSHISSSVGFSEYPKRFRSRLEGRLRVALSLALLKLRRSI